MLNNIDMLSSSLINVFNGNKNISQISILFDKNEANSLKNESNETIEIGSLVLAPLNIHRFDAISYIVEEVGLTKFTIDDYECILARAEVANITHYSHRSMVCFFPLFVSRISIILVHFYSHRFAYFTSILV